MIHLASPESGSSARLIALLAGVVVLGGVATWMFSGGKAGEQTQAPVVCAACSEPGTTAVGDTPGLEPWPRSCPKCGKNQLYLGQKCRNCNRQIPMKDPSADKPGQPTQCPWCKSPFREL